MENKTNLWTILIIIIFLFSANVYAADQAAPVISGPYPANNSLYISPNSTLNVSLFDINGDAINWTVSLFDGDSETWSNVASGYDSDGIANLSLNLVQNGTNLLKYGTPYNWRVSAIDKTGSGNTTEVIYSFSTRLLENYAPIISNPDPSMNKKNVILSPILQANIFDVDYDSVSWTIQLFNSNTSTWTTLKSGTNTTGNFTVSVNATTVNESVTNYTWKVTAFDSAHSGNISEQIYNFTTKLANTIPTISNVTPAGNATDVAFNPALKAEIFDQDNKSFNWTVQMYDLSNNQWVVLGAGTSVGGNFSINVPSPMVNQYNTTYNWTITVVDTLAKIKPVVENYTFISRLPIQAYSPMFTNMNPADGISAITPNSSLSAYVDEIYRDGKIFNVTISALNSTSNNWQVVRTYTNIANQTVTATATNVKGFFVNPMTTYFWKINAVDSSGKSTEQVFKFATGGSLTPKWNISFDNSFDYNQILPVMGDVDNDGTQEIIIIAGGNLMSINGKTGKVEWTLPEAASSAPELVDLNNDGTPEILYALGVGGPRLRAVNGNGSIRWTTPKLNGEGQSMFPINAYDTDGDGYPTIYFASEDQNPDPYDGNISDYDGALTMINASGVPLKHTWLHHPCWGGIAIGDTNFDGKFEVYVSDRRNGYHGFPAKGIQAFDADTLETLWSRPDIQHSSPMPVLIDVNGDGIQEVVATKITNAGPMVINAQTGQDIADYSRARIPTHGTPTIYDIDGDGRLEAIYASAYPDNADPEFAVFDLINGSTEFRPVLDYQVTWPPEVGNILGNDQKEMLVPTGSQGFTTASYPLLIYDSNYTLIDRVNIQGAGQLMPAKVFDVDSDGYNEVVLAGLRGRLYVYDTNVKTPNPAPRTWSQRYSESRRGVSEYVDLPGPNAPVVTNASPANNSVDSPLNPMLSAKLYDLQKDLFNITFEISNNGGGSWQTLQTYSNKSLGIYNADTAGLAGEYDTKYDWRVTSYDSNGNMNQKTFSFNTMAPGVWVMPGWNYKKMITIDHNKVAGNLTDFPVLIDITDPNMVSKVQSDLDDIMFTSGDGVTKLSHEIESFNSSTGRLTAWVKVPSLSSTNDTVLYMYYGNANASNQQNPEAVWDSNFLAVQHLEEKTGTIIDSTSNNNDGTAQNGVVQNAIGKINGADSFDGVDDRTVLPRVFTSENSFTFEGWMNSNNKQGYAISERDTAGNGAFIQYYSYGNNFQFYIGNKILQKPASSGSWHYVVGTFDGTTASLYVDGGSPVITTSSVTWPNQQMYLGDRSTSGRAFSGTLDEIRLSNVARSADYVKTNYNNQNDPSGFISITGEESAATVPIILNATPLNGATNVPINLTELSFDLDDNQNDLMNYVVTTNPIIGSANGYNVSNGHYAVNVNGTNASKLAYNTTYTWLVNVTDGAMWTHKLFNFTTAPLQCTDADADGFNASGDALCGIVDCNDNDTSINPAAGETADGIDNNCNGLIDENAVGSLLSDTTFDASTNTTDLRANAAGQDWYESRANWSGGNANLLTLDQTNVGGNAGKKAALKSYGISQSAAAYLTQEFPAQNETFNLSFEIYVDRIQRNSLYNRTGMVYVGNDADAVNNAPTGTANERFISLGFFDATPDTANDDIEIRARTLSSQDNAKTGTWTLVATGLSYDSWHNVTLAINPATGRFDAYVDGVLTGNQIQKYNGYTSKSINYVSFSADNSARGDFFIDNAAIPVNSSNSTPIQEICNDGIDNNLNGDIDCADSACTSDSSCQITCGNGVQNPLEECDDSNLFNNDGCSAICTIEQNWSCVGFPSICTATNTSNNSNSTPTDYCGDGLINATETCDDNNTASGDGCSATCTIEAGFTCNGAPSVCTANCVATTEVCDGVDNNCNGQIDENVTNTYYQDLDVDAYGSLVTSQACSVPSGYVSQTGDCNDSNATINPAESEICNNGVDDNCNGFVDENCSVINNSGVFTADATFDASSDTADLWNDAASQDWYESRASFAGGNESLLSLDQANIDGNTGKKAALKSYGVSQGSAYLTQGFDAMNSTFNVTFDIYIDRIQRFSTYNRTGMVYIGNDVDTTNCPTGTANERFAMLGFYDAAINESTSDLKIMARTLSSQNAAVTGSWTELADNLSYNAWHTITLVVNPATGRFDLYVDNVLTGNQIQKYSGYTAKTINYVSFSADNSARGDFFIDNAAVTQ
jgi:cysteine-rich repeat protein